MLDLIISACDAIDWRFVTLSRRRYRRGRVCTGLGDPHWLERPFAYEIYHQLRTIWPANLLQVGCVIHAEVLKTYQEIQDIDKMPDLLLHDPQSGRNVAVVEIKLTSNTRKNLREDLRKLALFRRALGYETLVEILIGSTREIRTSLEELNGIQLDCDIPIQILTIALEDQSTQAVQLDVRPAARAHRRRAPSPRTRAARP